MHYTCEISDFGVCEPLSFWTLSIENKTLNGIQHDNVGNS